MGDQLCYPLHLVDYSALPSRLLHKAGFCMGRSQFVFYAGCPSPQFISDSSSFCCRWSCRSFCSIAHKVKFVHLGLVSRRRSGPVVAPGRIPCTLCPIPKLLVSPSALLSNFLGAIRSPSSAVVAYSAFRTSFDPCRLRGRMYYAPLPPSSLFAIWFHTLPSVFLISFALCSLGPAFGLFFLFPETPQASTELPSQWCALSLFVLTLPPVLRPC